jgi:NitT/TauT family transport system permease protein
MRPARHTYARNVTTAWPVPNYWDVIAIILVLAIIVLLGHGAVAMVGKFQVGQQIQISLNPIYLPYYALRTVIRMFVAMFFSLLFMFVFGTWAAKSRYAGRIIIPIIDILQSVPVLGFLTITVVGFVTLFRGSLLGPECAAIFAIFTAQVWNMTLSFYQSLRTVPEDLHEAAVMFQLSPWQKFWRLEVPFAMPGLVWNAMLSMSGSWVFLVASESISVANQNITLPGIGSYIALAILQMNVTAVMYVILTMIIVIALYDQLLFRPLVAWSEKFKVEVDVGEVESESWLLNLFQRTHFLRFVGQYFSWLGDKFVNFRLFRRRVVKRVIRQYDPFWRKVGAISWNVLLVLFILLALFILARFIFAAVPWSETVHVFYLGFATALRVTILIFFSSLIWVPIGVWVGLNPKASRIVQPVAQFCAAFPVNLLFPIVVMAIVNYHLNVNIWTSPLMILGTQWYILFNVVAGTTALPKTLRHAAATLNVHGWLWWKRLILPGIFPYYITGAITAAGGAWNISIIAEAVSWGNIHLKATGLGAYIADVSRIGDFHRLALGITVMSLYVVIINRAMWRPLYNMAVERYRLQ